jgi:hypothetical protein
MAEKKHYLPEFLHGLIAAEAYDRWLSRKAAAHVKRDRKRGHLNVNGSTYRSAIHAAVLRSAGVDAYTGEKLDWHLISTYDNEQSKDGKHEYKASFALLPTVDHIEASSTSASFHICAWRTNDAKNDLSTESFLDLCAKVLRHAGYDVKRTGTSD